MKKPVNFKKNFNNISIGNKLLLIYLLVVFLPILFVGMFLTISMKNMAMDRAIGEAYSNVDRVKERVTDVLNVPIGISNNLYINSELNEILTTKFKSDLDVVQSYWSFRNPGEYIKTYKNEIQNIRVYVSNKTLLESANFRKITEDIKSEQWYKNAIKNHGHVAWNYIGSDDFTGKKDYTLSLTRLISKEGVYLGIMVIDVNKNYLYSILQQESFDTMLLDSKGTIVSAKDTSIIGKNEKALNLDVSNKALEDGIYESNYKGEPSKLIVNNLKLDSPNSDLKVISVFSIKSTLSEANKVSYMGFTIIAISLIFTMIIIIIFSRALSKRVKMLSRDMHQVAQGDFDVIASIKGRDEFGQLAGDLNTMTRSLKQLVQEVYEADLKQQKLIIEQKEIKLNMLANQINPHFLFNALETVRMKAHCKGEQEISEIVQRLGGLLRRNLEVGSSSVPLTKEIDLVKDYLEIQKFRFGSKLSYVINVYEDISNFKVLPFILQPIVENAVKHGLESKEEDGNINIEVRKINALLHINIIDDGIGIDDSKLSDLINSLEGSSSVNGKGIGIRNVHQRIKLYYGDEYGLTIDSKVNEGTCVEITLPWKNSFHIE